MRKTNQILALAAIATLSGLTTSAMAITYTRSDNGTANWDSGWTSTGGTYPNAPTDIATLTNTANLALNLNVTNAIVGQLNFGVAGFTTDIGNSNSSGNRLTFDNTAGGNNSDGNANAAITSLGGGTATNIISGPVYLTNTAATPSTTASLNITAASTNNLSFTGGFIGTYSGTAANGTTNAPNFTRSIINNLGANQTLTISGPVSTEYTSFPSTAGNVVAALQFGQANTAAAVTTDPAARFGTTIIDGVISNGPGITNGTNNYTVSTQVIIGSGGTADSRSIGTVVLNGNNTYTGQTRLFRANLVLGSDTALGTGAIQHGSGAANGSFGYNIASTADSRTIANAMTMQRNITINGSNSLTWNGTWTQSNASNLINLLPAGKTFTLGGLVTTNNGNTAGNTAAFTFDGSGNTNVTNDIINNNNTALTSPNTFTGLVVKNGLGTVTLAGAANFTPVVSTTTGTPPVTTFAANSVSYTGLTAINGGVLVFNSLTTGTGSSSASVNVNAGGGVAVVGGSLTSPLLTKLQAGVATNSGAILLQPATSDSSTSVNFAGLGNASGLSLGALGSVTYTGTITPANSTYRLGGPNGTLTLPGTNALTGTNALAVVNGGTVALTGTNNNTGDTTVQGNYIVTSQQAAIANSPAIIQSGIYVSPTLSVSNIADGASSIGNGANINVRGGTLAYVGSTDQTTSKVLSVGPTGATLDSSGTGAITFSAANVAVPDTTSTITGTTTTAGNQITAVTGDVSNLAVGMSISGGTLGATATITGINPQYSATTGAITYTIRTSANATTGTTAAPLTFGNQSRTLTLTGTNAAANTIAGSIADSATGKTSITKTGAGAWALGGTNTYTGATTVSGGVLSVNTPSAISAGSAVTVGGGASAAVYKIGWNGTTTTASIALPTLIANGRFDIGQGRVLLTNKTATEVAALVGNGATGTGSIFTSSFGSGKAVGFGDIGGGGTTVRFTYQGDADLNGQVDFNDFLVLQNNFNQAGFFSQGDFDYSGTVNFNDFLVLQNNFNKNIGSGAVAPMTAAQVAAITSFAATVPEPTSLTLLGLGAAAALRRRRAC